jgi:NAD(P)-dependent dehydrogenase (short-subunit alcohol dehydrogenase family)
MAEADRAPVALVTGAGRGIGLEVARQLADAGSAVILTARDGERARAAAEPPGATALALDVDDAGSVAWAADAVRAAPGRLDVLVNNAAAFAPWEETVAEADLSAVHSLLGTNVLGPWRTLQAFFPCSARAPPPGWSTWPARPGRTATRSSAWPCRSPAPRATR